MPGPQSPRRAAKRRCAASLAPAQVTTSGPVTTGYALKTDWAGWERERERERASEREARERGAPRRGGAPPRSRLLRLRAYLTERINYMVLESQLPHKIVNLLLAITNYDSKAKRRCAASLAPAPGCGDEPTDYELRTCTGDELKAHVSL